MMIYMAGQCIHVHIDDHSKFYVLFHDIGYSGLTGLAGPTNIQPRFETSLA